QPGGHAANNDRNFLINNYPQLMPVPERPMIVDLKFDRATLISQFFLDNGTAPVATAKHVSGDPGGGDGRNCFMSWTPSVNSLCFEGKAQKFFEHDNSNPATAMMPSQRAGIIAEWRARYGT